MFQKSALTKRREAIHKLLSNGYKFAIIQDETAKKFFRYRYEAKHHMKRGTALIALSDLLNTASIEL